MILLVYLPSTQLFCDNDSRAFSLQEKDLKIFPAFSSIPLWYWSITCLGIGCSVELLRKGSEKNLASSLPFRREIAFWNLDLNVSAMTQFFYFSGLLKRNEAIFFHHQFFNDKQPFNLNDYTIHNIQFRINTSRCEDDLKLFYCWPRGLSIVEFNRKYKYFQ